MGLRGIALEQPENCTWDKTAIPFDSYPCNNIKSITPAAWWVLKSMHPSTQIFMVRVTNNANVLFFVGMDGSPKIFVLFTSYDVSDDDDITATISEAGHIMATTLTADKLAPKTFLINDAVSYDMPAKCNVYLKRKDAPSKKVIELSLDDDIQFRGRLFSVMMNRRLSDTEPKTITLPTTEKLPQPQTAPLTMPRNRHQTKETTFPW